MSTPLKPTLTALLASLTLAGCTDHAAIEKSRALETENEQLSRLKDTAENETERMKVQVEAIRQEREKLKAEKTKVEQERDAASKEVEHIKKEFQAYRDHYKLSMKQNAPGMHVADFAVNGQAYHNVVLKALTDDEVNFSHDAGVSRLSTSLLPDSMRDKLGLNLPPPGAALDIASMDPKAVNAARLSDYNAMVTKAENARRTVFNKLELARRALNDTQGHITAATLNKQPLGKLKLKAAEQEKALLKLEGEAAAADVSLYQARRETPKLVTVPH